MRTISILTAIFCLAACAAVAQPLPGNAAGVSMGHVHIRTQDLEAHKKYWSAMLQTQSVKHGQLEVFTFKGAVLLVQKAEAKGASEGSVVDHFAVEVPDMAACLGRLKAAGFPVAEPKLGATGLFLYGPDGVKVEVMENKALAVKASHHHLHFSHPETKAMQAWYAKMFGGKAGFRNKFEAVDLPGVNLTFTNFKKGTAPTKGRALDHIGFEVKNLEAFCKKLEAAGVKFDVPYKTVPSLNIGLAFLTDPWGSNIELTEGLDRW